MHNHQQQSVACSVWHACSAFVEAVCKSDQDTAAYLINVFEAMHVRNGRLVSPEADGPNNSRDSVSVSQSWPGLRTSARFLATSCQCIPALVNKACPRGDVVMQDCKRVPQQIEAFLLKLMDIDDAHEMLSGVWQAGIGRGVSLSDAFPYHPSMAGL